MLFGEAYFLAISLSVGFVIVVSLFACVCGCRKKVPHNEFMGLAGMVKIRNPDYGLSAVSVQRTKKDLETEVYQVFEDNRFPQIVVPSRSLPELPVENQTSNPESGKLSGETQNSAGDTASELYATLDGYKNGENSYAQLRNGSVPLDRVEERSGSPFRADSNAVGTSSQVHNQVAAAIAIAGDIAGGVEIPYMTPPLQPTYFSGDSQDSGKGYTSISVREPICNITSNWPRQRFADSHYAAISDDSDDTYAAILENTNSVHTYSQVIPASLRVNRTDGASGVTSEQNRDAFVSESKGNDAHDGPSNAAEYSVPHVSDMYAKVNKKVKTDKSNSPTLEDTREEECDCYTCTSGGGMLPHYEMIASSSKCCKIDANRNIVYNSEDSPGYEIVQEQESSSAYYERITEPNYEEISRSSVGGADVDANYEELKQPNSLLYSKVMKKAGPSSICSSISEPQYASLRRTYSSSVEFGPNLQEVSISKDDMPSTSNEKGVPPNEN